MTLARLAISVGEPAGIGPDVVLAAAQEDWDTELVLIADQNMLEERAARLGVSLVLQRYDPQTPVRSGKGVLSILHSPLAQRVAPGDASAHNAQAVLAALTRGARGCLAGEFAALVTAPINKAVINASGVAFSGHTEYLAELTQSPQVVMLLVAGELRVALATTHLPLSQVPQAISTALLETTLDVIHQDLQRKFKIAEPRISVLGLNPHAGEDGYLGREEIDIISPVIQDAQSRGMRISGPWPADTAFNARLRSTTDVYLAMYHDQGLPVLKYAGFGASVNITLGLPIVRTSVDHGTAFDIAGTGRADPGSLIAAIRTALDLA